MKRFENVELCLAFCEAYEDLFGEYLDHVHEIESTDTGVVLRLAKEELALCAREREQQKMALARKENGKAQ